MNELNLLNCVIPIELPMIELMDVPCPICGGNPHDFLGDITVNEARWHIDYCKSCDLWWVNPRPSENFYGELYQKYFYKSPIPEQFGYASLEIDSDRRTQKAVKNWDDIEPHIKNVRRDCFLEIGCATGELLIEAQKRGFQKITGVEIEKECCDIAKTKGLDVICSPFEQVTNYDGQFNLIFADNVIEHFLDPVSVVRKCAELQTKDGCLIFRLPDTPPEGPRLKLIDHTFHYTRASIRRLFKKCGYTVETIFHSGRYTSPDQKNYIDNMTVVGSKDG